MSAYRLYAISLLIGLTTSISPAMFQTIESRANAKDEKPLSKSMSDEEQAAVVNPLANPKRTHFPARIWNSSAEIPVAADHPNAEGSTAKSNKIDESMKAVIAKFQIPGAQLAIARNGNIVYSRGFGYADLASKSKVQPHSLFRTGSLSKCITSVAVFKLQEEGKLNLSDKVFHVLPEMVPDKNTKCDARLLDVKIADLLNMTAGWDKKRRGETLFLPTSKRIQRKYETLSPPPLESVCQYQLSKNLDWAPGTHFSYSNLSYALLGRIIEEKSEADYTDYCQSQIFKPLSITAIQASKHEPGKRLEGEVTYYPENLNSLKQSFFTTDVGKKASPPYGRIDIERYTSAFGWASDAESMLKFLDGMTGLLSKTSIDQMLSRPAAEDWVHASNYVASSFECSSDFGKGASTIFKDGTLSGTRAFLIKYPDGTSCCALFNRRPRYTKADPLKKEMLAVFESARNF